MAYSLTDYWRVDLEDDIVPADHHTSQQPATVVGETADRQLLFSPTDVHARPREDRHAAVRRLSKHTDAYTIETTIDGPAVYSEHHPGTSLLVALRPPDGLATARGLWGLLDGIPDIENVSQTHWPLGLSIAYLADLNEYADHAAVRSALEHEGFR